MEGRGRGRVGQFGLEIYVDYKLVGQSSHSNHLISQLEVSEGYIGILRLESRIRAEFLFFFFLLLAVLGFELRDLHLLGRLSTT
jgi:hypothetical protein